MRANPGFSLRWRRKGKGLARCGWGGACWGGVLLLGCVAEYNISDDKDMKVTPTERPIQATAQEDRIRQVAIHQVDVLWVIDNSCSMWEEQVGIARHADSFLRFFLGKELDYHIGVISTDTLDPAHSGRLRQVEGHRFLDAYTEEPERVFKSMVQMGTTGHWDERGFDAVVKALDGQALGYNMGFRREDASLHVIVISDENDYSWWTPPEFTNWLAGRIGSPTWVSFSSIVGPEESCPGVAEPGIDYLQVTRALGGVEWSICDDAWATVLELLGLESTGLSSEFFLSRLPVVESIQVEIHADGVVFAYEPEEDWVYDAARNSISFVQVIPEATADVVIRYTVRGT